jgi:NO-binding membrane sensor protein with MHYT domain
MVAGDWSVLLWSMAVIVAMLSSHLFIAWIRRAQGLQRPRDAIGPAAVSGGALAVGLSSAMVLALGAERLAFPLGYRWPALPLLLVVAFSLSLGAAWSLIRRQSLPALAGAGLLMSLASLAVQVGWLQAAGFRPGLIWNLPLAAGAATAALVGYTAAMWLAYSDGSSNGARRTLWRLGAATLMVLTMVASQEVLITAAGLPLQIGSIFRRELSSTWLTLVAGAVVPTVMALMVLDVALRNHGDSQRNRRSPTGVELDLPRPRKRRKRYWTL